MNREEISRIVRDVKGRISNDVRAQVTNMLRQSGKTVDAIANDLQIDNGVLRAIVDGASDMSLSTFVKLMVATGNTIEVKNIASLANGRPRPMGGRMVPPPHPMVHGVGNQHSSMRRPNPMNIPPLGMSSINEIMGGSRPWDRPNVNEVSPLTESESSLHEKRSHELINIIYSNGWGDEINVNGATRTDLINFILSKMNNNVDNPSRMTMELPIDEVTNFNEPQNEVDSEKERIANGIADLIRNNPQIAEKLARFIPRN